MKKVERGIRFLVLALLILGGGISLISCENFFNGADLRKQIEDEVAYNNSPTHTIKVEAPSRESGRIIKPLAGELYQKVTDTFLLSFEPASDFNFNRWEAYNSQTGEVLSGYVEFENAENPETKAILKKADVPITIRPVCPSKYRLPVKIDGSHGKFYPAKETYSFIEGEVYHIEFEADSDFAFLRWEVVDEASGEVIDADTFDDFRNNSCIRIRDAGSEKTDVEIVNIPRTIETPQEIGDEPEVGEIVNGEEEPVDDDPTEPVEEPVEDENSDPTEEPEDSPGAQGISFIIRPVVVERPQTISVSPQRNSSGVYKDTTIQVMFDYDMSEDSIYYTDDEIQNITEQLLPPVTMSDGSKKYYGYKKDDGTVYFKNISITNSRNGANLNDRFAGPVFENHKTLSIPVDRKNPLAPGTNVMVTLNKDFFYETDEEKAVSMSQAKKWVYLVNGDTDTLNPTITNIEIKDSLGNSLTPSTSAPSVTNISALNFFKAGEFNLFAKIHDNTAPDSTFNIILNKLYDASYNPTTTVTTYTRNISYSTCYGENAIYGEETETDSIPLSCKLTNIPDGVYSMSFEFKDGSGNSKTWPENNKLYYFSLDGTAPSIAAPSVSAPENSSTSLDLSWKPSSAKDYSSAFFEYRKYGTSNFDGTTERILKGTDTATISGLEAGTRYTIRANYLDIAGNVNHVYVYPYTRPAAPKSVTVSTGYGTSATLTATKPDSGNFTNMSLRYRKTGEETWSTRESFTVDSSGSGSKTISNLERGFVYEFEVCSYDSISGQYSPAYESESSYPTFATIPNAPASVGITDEGISTNSITVNWSAPSIGSYDGFIVYCSKYSDFSNASASPALAKTKTSHTFSALEPGTKYYVRVAAYYRNQGNLSYKNLSNYTYTKAVPVTNLEFVSSTKNSLTVKWTKPNNGINTMYAIGYKKTSESSYSWLYEYNSSATSYTIEGLEGGEFYNISVLVFSYNYSERTDNPSAGWQLCPKAVSNLCAEKQSDTSFKLTWTAPAGNYDGYNLYYGKKEDFSDASQIQITKGTTEKTITGLSAKGLYYIKMESYIGTATSASRLKTDETTVCSLKLDGVKNISASPTATSKIKLTWTCPDSDRYDGIRIYRNSTLVTTLTKGTTSWEDSSLATNTSYTYAVETYKTENGETLTAAASRTCRTYSAQVKNLTATTNAPGKVTLSWTNPTSGEYYRIKIYNGSSLVTSITNKSTTSYTVENLTGGSYSTFYLKTDNNDYAENNISAPSASSYTMPMPVTGLTWSSAASDVKQTSAKISWTKPTGSYTGFKVYYRKNSESTWTLFNTYGSTYTGCTVTGLAAGTYYNFKVETYYSYVTNSSSYSYPTCYGYTNCNPVSSVSISSRTATSLTVQWSKPSSGGYGGARIYYKKSSDSSFTYKNYTTGTSYTISGLTQGTSYDIYIASYYYTNSESYMITGTATGTGSSYPLKASTNPGAPTSLSAQATNGDVKVSWAAPTNGATGYYIYWKLKSASSWSDTNRGYTTNTYYTLSNTLLLNSTEFDFKVKARKDVNSEVLYSSDSSSISFYTMPGAVLYPSLYCDDTMGTVTIRWYNPSSDLSYVNIYLDSSTSYTCYLKTSDKSTYVTKSFQLPNFYRGKTYTVRLRPSHTKNGSEMEGPETTLSLTSSMTNNTNIMVNGSRIAKSSLTTVLSSDHTVSKTTSGCFTSKRTITLSKYSMGTYEVTQELFKAVMGYNPTSMNYNSTNFPVTDVSWYEAIAFCNKLSVLQGLDPCYTVAGVSNWTSVSIPTSSNANWNNASLNQNANGYHLPTECQWEFAARGGSETATDWGYKYAGASGMGNVGWYTSNSGGKTHEVGTKNSNRLGLFDMSGNVVEMLTDWNYDCSSNEGTFKDPYCGYSTAKGTSTFSRKSGSDILTMGGHWDRGESHCCISSEDQTCPAYEKTSKRGFRICRNAVY